MDFIPKQAHPPTHLVEGATYVWKYHFNVHLGESRTPDGWKCSILLHLYGDWDGRGLTHAGVDAVLKHTHG